MSYMTKDKKKEIFKEYGGKEVNTGAVEGQIALFSYRIKEISNHLQDHKQDHASRRALLKLVGKRKRLLQYYARKDINAYRELIKKLEIRK